MSSSDKNETLVQLSRIAIEKFYDRRVVEWKVNFGVWTLLVAFSALIASKNITNASSIGLVIISIFAGLGLVLIHFYWLYSLHQRNCLDKKVHHWYEKKVLEDLKLHDEFSDMIAELKESVSNQYWSMIPTLLVSFLLALSGVIIAIANWLNN